MKISRAISMVRNFTYPAYVPDQRTRTENLVKIALIFLLLDPCLEFYIRLQREVSIYKYD